MNAKQALEFGERLLSSHECPGADPRREALDLLSHASGLTREQLLTRPETDLAQKVETDFSRNVSLRREHWPIERIVGRVHFLGCDIEVGRDVLVPRPATEMLTERAVSAARKDGSRLAVDVGTGSGCIAVAMARKLPRVRVMATDLSPDAIATARRNAELCGCADRIEFVFGDLAEGAAEAMRSADGPVTVVANLPYIPTAMMAELPPEVSWFEPKMALDGGHDGLKYYHALLKQLAGMELENGLRLFMEILPEQAKPLAHVAKLRFPQAEMHALTPGREGKIFGLEMSV